MKQAILSFGKADVLLRVPDIHQAWVLENIRVSGITSDGRDWKFLGKLSELTEEQFAEIVDWVEPSQYYTDYRKAGWQGDISAHESFLSKLEAEGYYTENPRLKPELVYHRPGEAQAAAIIAKAVLKSHEDAEARTFPPDQTYVFIILKQQS